MTELRPGAWRRAALLTVVVFVHLVLAAPVPHVVTVNDLRKEASKRELRAWSERLGAVGIALGPEELGVEVRRWTGWIGGTHRALKAPYSRVRRWTGTSQGWALFAVPAAHPPRFEIRIRRKGSRDGETVFLHLDPEHDWWRERLVYRRLRGLWNEAGHGRRPSGVYRRFARWIADRAFEEFPDATFVTVRQLVTHTPLPGDPPDDSTTPRYRLTLRRTP